MKKTIRKQLQEWALTYETKAFIPQDPIQFPHRYSEQTDREISGLLTAFISFGNRKMICRKADELDGMMKNHPHEYVLGESWRTDFPEGDTRSFYRTCSFGKMHELFALLHSTYSRHRNLEEALLKFSGSPRERICQWMGVSSQSPQKKLNMYLRWMIRRDSEVDFGIWSHFSPSELLIPLDTHVVQVAHELGLTSRSSYSLKQAQIITEALEEVFPMDPCKGDFALFGYGVNRSRKEDRKSDYKGSTSK